MYDGHRTFFSRHAKIFINSRNTYHCTGRRNPDHSAHCHDGLTHNGNETESSWKRNETENDLKLRLEEEVVGSLGEKGTAFEASWC